MAAPFDKLPERHLCQFGSDVAIVGFEWVRPQDLELSEGHLLADKTLPRGLTAAVSDWEAHGIPPLFADLHQEAGSYCLQDGHRRWKAADLARLKLVPVVWVDSDTFHRLLESGDRLDARNVVFAELGLAPVGPVPETSV